MSLETPNRTAKTAITTLTIGEDFTRIWNEHFRQGWETYAARHG